MDAPLADLRIVAVEQFGAGPFGTLQLADLGAEVIKIEDPDAGGDVSRYVPPYQEGEDSLYFESFNRGKKSVSLDLRDAEGRAAFEDLVRGADAVFSNLRGDGAEKLGLTYAALGPVNPAIVCCSLSGFGNTGPRRDEGAYDHVIQGLAGWMSLTGGPDDPPMKSGLSLVDFAGGYVAALSIVAAVWRARRDGVGGDCDLSLFETALALLTYQGTWVASRGYAPERLANSAHQSIVPFQGFETADGWLMVACAKEKFWLRLIEVLGPRRPRGRSALRDLRRPPREPRARGRRARGGAAQAEHSPLGRRPPRGGRPGAGRQRRRRRAGRSAGRRARRHRRGRAPRARHGPARRQPAARPRRTGPGHPRSLPRRAHGRAAQRSPRSSTATSRLKLWSRSRSMPNPASDSSETNPCSAERTTRAAWIAASSSSSA